ncbi:MAG: ABC transporter permease, partial [Patescibacteria group bacterium]|nr:ABC transporter permease [Patescibacteria group bacterium]
LKCRHRQSVKALFANPARTGLTTLGIVIGIATVILVLSAGEGFRSLINAQLEAYGTNTLFVETRVPPTTKNRSAGAASADTGRANSPVAITSFKNRDLQDIKQIPNVVNDYGVVVGQKVVSYKDVDKSVIFYGASPERFDIDKGTLKAGRFFSVAENTGADQVVLLGSTLASDLFGQEDPVGKLIRVGDLNFEVIGVYNPRGGLGGDEDNTLYMPLFTAQKKLLGIDYLLFAIVQVKDTKLADATAEDIRQVMRHNHAIKDVDKDDFLVQTQADSLNTFNTIFNGITILLIAIAAISLVVGGVGIMNIMYVVVTERTAEIGLKKALGAKSSDVLNEFLIESILVTVIGGAVGIFLGSVLGWLVSLVATASGLSWKYTVPFYAIALGFGVSAVIGILFGVLPARSAAKLDPIEALRYE